MSSFITRNQEQSVVLSRGLTDVVKFAAAIMVAFGHYAGHALSFSNNPVYRITVMFAGNVGVALFFFLSGYGLMMSERKQHLALWPFLKRRLAKVYLPVVMVSVVWQIILWPVGAGWERIPHFLYSVFWGFSDGILWFVKVIIICYFLFRIYLVFKQKWGGNAWISLLVGTVFVYILVHVFFASWAAISIPLFSLGIVMADYNSLFVRIIRSWRMVIVVVFITIIMMTLYLLQGNLYIHSLCNWYVILGFIVICSRYKIEFVVPSWVGNISYDIYITHNKVINYLKPIYNYIGLHHFIVGAIIAATASFTLRKLLKR